MRASLVAASVPCAATRNRPLRPTTVCGTTAPACISCASDRPLSEAMMMATSNDSRAPPRRLAVASAQPVILLRSDVRDLKAATLPRSLRPASELQSGLVHGRRAPFEQHQI